MDQASVKACGKLLQRLMTDPIHSRFFLEPVDEEAHGAPGYYQIVKNPMDFTTIRARLARARATGT